MSNLTYKQREMLYVLKRNAPAPSPRKHILVRRAVEQGLPNATIAEAIVLSVRQVQRVAKGQSH